MHIRENTSMKNRFHKNNRNPQADKNGMQTPTRKGHNKSGSHGETFGLQHEEAAATSCCFSRLLFRASALRRTASGVSDTARRDCSCDSPSSCPRFATSCGVLEWSHDSAPLLGREGHAATKRARKQDAAAWLTALLFAALALCSLPREATVRP